MSWDEYSSFKKQFGSCLRCIHRACTFVTSYNNVMGRLLADQIADEANKPVIEDYDIENENVFEHQDKDSSDEADSGDEELGKDHYASVEKSRLRKDEVELDAKYEGVIGSRASALGSDEVEEEQASEEEASEEEASEEEASEEEASEDEASEEDAMPFRTDSEDESAPGEDMGSEEEPGEGKAGKEWEDEEEKSQRTRLAALVQAERRKAASNFSEATQRDASKGFAILEQSKLFDNVIDVRMKLQKALTDVNRLPVSKDSWKQCTSPDTAKLLKHTVKLLNKILGQLTGFRREFQTGDQISDSSKSGGKHKRNFEELTADTSELDDQLRLYRSAVLHKWSTKISAASGSSAMNSGKFKAINQPADVQVENQLADLPRLIKRTRLSRKGVVPLCFEEDRSSGRLVELQTEEAPDEVDAADIPTNYDPRRKGIDAQGCPYIFDDEDFYRVLLNDLVDKKINNARNQGTGAQIAITARSNKLKKDVDTKASKGRKLNYAVQEPIANYETPRTSATQWSDEQIDEFFAGLIGQKVNFDETEQQLEDDEAIKNDDIQIFG